MQKFFTFKSEKAAEEYYWKHIGTNRSKEGCASWIANDVTIAVKLRVLSPDGNMGSKVRIKYYKGGSLK